MALPFSPEQFLQVMSQYNLAVWPIQALLYVLAGAALYAVYRKKHTLVSAILALFWVWVGIFYHALFFTKINKAAYLFGTAFVIQGILFAWMAWKKKLDYLPQSDLYGWTGMFFVLFGLAIYPALNLLLGHWWPQMPTFGLPCPTTIFTFGLLLWTKPPKYALIIPLLWSLIGVSAAISLGIWEDIMLVVAGLVSTGLLWSKR